MQVTPAHREHALELAAGLPARIIAEPGDHARWQQTLQDRQDRRDDVTLLTPADAATAAAAEYRGTVVIVDQLDTGLTLPTTGGEIQPAQVVLMTLPVGDQQLGRIHHPGQPAATVHEFTGPAKAVDVTAILRRKSTWGRPALGPTAH